MIWSERPQAWSSSSALAIYDAASQIRRGRRPSGGVPLPDSIGTCLLASQQLSAGVTSAGFQTSVRAASNALKAAGAMTTRSD